MWGNIWSWSEGRDGDRDRVVGFHCGEQIWRASPYIYPPFKGVMTWHYLLWIETECYVVELHEADPSGCSGVFPMEVCDQIRSVDVIPGFPRVVFDAESLPFDKILQFLVDHSAVQNFLHYPFLFSIYDLRERRGLRVPSLCRVFQGWSKFDSIENWV